MTFVANDVPSHPDATTSNAPTKQEDTKEKMDATKTRRSRGAVGHPRDIHLQRNPGAPAIVSLINGEIECEPFDQKLQLGI